MEGNALKQGNRRNGQRRTSRVDVQVFVMTGLLVVLSCAVSFAVGYGLVYSSMIEELQDRAKSLHEYLEDRLDSSMFSSLEVRADEERPVYADSRQGLKNAREAAGVRYLYTAKRTAEGKFIYLVDGLSADSPDFRYVGDAIEPECIPDMERALSGETVLPETIASTTWGHVFISYFPMHDGGEVVGVLGMEFDAELQFGAFRNMSLATFLVIAFACLTAAVVAVFLFRRISNPRYHDLANTDFLTGLKNRNAFQVDLHNLEHRHGRERAALASIDLDGLKQVNDASGHDTGDRYIREAAKLLTGCMRRPEALYRTGGDEFAALLPDSSREELEELLRRLEKPRADTPGVPQVKLSLGYALFDPAQDASLEDTFRRADQEMYRRKKEKRQTT